MRRYTITLNEGPQMDIVDMHINIAKKYIAENGLKVVKVEEHIRDAKFAAVITLKEVQPAEMGL